MMKARFSAVLVSALLLAPSLAARPAPAPLPTQPAAVASTAPVPAPATYTLSREKRAQAIAYARARYRLHFAAFAWGVLVLLAMVALRVGPWFRDLAESSSRRHFTQAAAFVTLLLATQAVLELPIGIYGHDLALFYGVSIERWGPWLWDQAKSLFVGLAIAVPLAWLLYGILRRSPRRWWLWFWLALLPILVFLIFLTPLVIDPLFFRFEPLAPKHPELARGIEEVTVRVGEPIAPDRMFEMNASSKYRTINAYVTGLGASKRVVVWDTTIAKATIPETLFVFGHEMGHYVLLHIPKTIAFLWGLFFVLLALAAWTFGRLFGAPERWGIRGLSDWASMPVLLLFLTVGGELATPIIGTYSRAQEHQADVFGLEAIHGLVPDSPRVAAGAFQLLGEVNLDDPDPGPFITFWLYDHPPVAERLRFAAEYDPWGKGEKPKYVR